MRSQIHMTEAEMRRMLAAPVSRPSTPTPRGRGRCTDALYANKLEAAYAALLDVRKTIGEVYSWWYEPFGLRLAPKTFYHPDFLVQLADGLLEVHETKGGFIRDDSIVKLKVAARLYPCFRFIMIQSKKGGWIEKEIL